MVGEELVVSNIAIVVTVALLSGLLFTRLKQPDILGYVLTGIILGPSCFALIHTREAVHVFADLGALMLLFTIGMELNIQTLKKNMHISCLCVLLQVMGGLLISTLVSFFVNWPLYFTVALGFVFALSSTAVVMNTLEIFDLKKTKIGTTIIGVLIVQDIAIVPMILILKALTGGGHDWKIITKVFISLSLIVLFLTGIEQLTRSQRLLSVKRILGSNRNLYMLTALSLCFASAALAELSGLSAPCGAFLAGLALGNLSDTQDSFLESIHSIQKVLLMIFFLSIGLLLDIQFIWVNVKSVGILLILVTVIKTLLNILVFRFVKVRLAQASFMGVALAQLGEFAFVLTAAFRSSPQPEIVFAQKCLIALTVLSLICSPLWFQIAHEISELLQKRSLSSWQLLSYISTETGRALKNGCVSVWVRTKRAASRTKSLFVQAYKARVAPSQKKPKE
jgi:CPA2 family monovalent cation:H+ antiporter-2